MKCGFVALLGRPNVGKSSIINALLNEKVAAVSPKPQTTRNMARCILTGDDFQIVFMDTPGVHEPQTVLGDFMMSEVMDSLAGTDLVCYVVEAGDMTIKKKDALILSAIAQSDVPVILVVNKTDKFKAKDYYLKTAEVYEDALKPEAVVPLSAAKGFNLELLVDEIKRLLPEQPTIYSDDIVMDSTERFLAAEIIREKIFLLTEEEVPHSSAVVVEDFKSPEEYPDMKSLKIRADIIVDRPGQKGIIIGKNGTKIKEIRASARKDLEAQFGYKVVLDLWVKVKPGWRKSAAELRRLGYVF
jgi:GTP-binding protein Era